MRNAQKILVVLTAVLSVSIACKKNHPEAPRLFRDTPSATGTVTNSPTQSLTPTITGTSTNTGTSTDTPTPTLTFSNTYTHTPTVTSTMTGTIPPTPVLTGEILFTGVLGDSSPASIFKMNPDGSGKMSVVEGDQGRWNYDKSLIVFCRDHNIWVMNTTSLAATQITFYSGIPSYLFHAGGLSPDWSRDGSKILYTYAPPDLNPSEMHWIKPDGTNDTLIVNPQDPKSYSPRWVSNNRIVFVGNKDETLGEIYEMDIDGSNLSRIVNHMGFIDSTGIWNPAYTLMAFSSCVIYPRDDVYLFDGTNLKNFTNGNGKESLHWPLVWSPDGQYLVWGWAQTEYGMKDIFRIQVNGTFETNLTNTPNYYEEPTDWK